MKEATRQAPARTRGPHRGVGLLITMDLDRMVPLSSPVRGIWQVTGQLDWEGYLSRLRARGSRPGRSALHPRVLATLWLYGMSQGVASARELARRCQTDLACLWALGGQTSNHHSLSAFLRQEPEMLEGLLSQTIWCLRSEEAVSFDTLLLDGTKVDARASAESFRSEAEVRSRLSAQLSRLRHSGSGETAAQQRQHRREAELAEKYARASAKARQRQELARGEGPVKQARALSGKVSVTDAEARLMRRADGGKRASVNVQLGCCAQSGAVLHVGATDQGNDAGLAASAVRGMERVCGVRPVRVVADGGYSGVRSAKAMRDLGVLFLAPPPAAAVSPSRRACLREARSAEDWWREWWAKCGTEARRLRLRVERVIGSLKRRGLRRVPVFGLAGARGWALWHAIAHHVLLCLGIRG